MSEERMTESEWQRRKALRICATVGHEWNITSLGDGQPIRLHCGSCGWSGGVAMGEKPSASSATS